MKKLSYSSIADISMIVTYSIDAEIAASDISRFKLPEGPVISDNREELTQQMIDDFEAFMDDVEILCEENYGLIGTYKNISNDHSHYYNYLAKDENGNIIVRFRLRLRASNHLPKRTKQQQQNKKAELQSEKLRSLLDDSQIKKLRPHTLIITINDKRVPSYQAAFEQIDEVIGHAVEIMTR